MNRQITDYAMKAAQETWAEAVALISSIQANLVPLKTRRMIYKMAGRGG